MLKWLAFWTFYLKIKIQILLSEICDVVSLDKNLYSTFCLSNNVYKTSKKINVQSIFGFKDPDYFRLHTFLLRSLLPLLREEKQLL